MLLQTPGISEVYYVAGRLDLLIRKIPKNLGSRFRQIKKSDKSNNYMGIGAALLDAEKR